MNKLKTTSLYSVDSLLMGRIYFALETARDNALECLNNHIVSIKGKHTTEEMRLSNLLADDVNEAEDLIKVFTDTYGKFGK